ncbi:MAG: type II toxin-antitoxin system VapC family toxin [Betaproteobacteria bacterium]
MALVLDASIAVAWVVPSQKNAYAARIRVRARREPFHVPEIFTAEVANVLVTLQRRRILSEEAASAATDILGRLDPVVHSSRHGVQELRALALRFGLSAYDAAYLALAIELRLPMACGDRPLRTALPKAGVRLA